MEDRSVLRAAERNDADTDVVLAEGGRELLETVGAVVDGAADKDGDLLLGAGVLDVGEGEHGDLDTISKVGFATDGD